MTYTLASGTEPTGARHTPCASHHKARTEISQKWLKTGGGRPQGASPKTIVIRSELQLRLLPAEGGNRTHNRREGVLPSLLQEHQGKQRAVPPPFSHSGFALSIFASPAHPFCPSLWFSLDCPTLNSLSLREES